MATLSLRNATKSYGAIKVIHGIDLDIADREFVVFVGPSGCGKSTLLRLVAGLEDLDEGTVHIGDRDVTDLEPVDRGIAMVFQNYALYPHMTVEENMSFGLKVTGVPQAEIRARVIEAARSLQLEDFLARKPAQLSGGQRQRVAIGRAMVRKPKVFLFDEPLSNLDAELRVHMRIEIAKLHNRLDSTMIYVTHDQVEAMTLADKIVVLRAGRIEQVGSPLDLYDNPDNLFVAGFIGSPRMNLLAARVTGVAGSTVTLGLDGQIEPLVRLQIGHHRLAPGAAVTLGIRPEHLTRGPGEGQLAVTPDFTEQLGVVSYLHGEAANGSHIIAEQRGRLAAVDGDRVILHFDPAAAFLFDPSGARLR